MVESVLGALTSSMCCCLVTCILLLGVALMWFKGRRVPAADRAPHAPRVTTTVARHEAIEMGEADSEQSHSGRRVGAARQHGATSVTAPLRVRVERKQ